MKRRDCGIDGIWAQRLKGHESVPRVGTRFEHDMGLMASLKRALCELSLHCTYLLSRDRVGKPDASFSLSPSYCWGVFQLRMQGCVDAGLSKSLIAEHKGPV